MTSKTFLYKEFLIEGRKEAVFHANEIIPFTKHLREDYNLENLTQIILRNVDLIWHKTYVAYVCIGEQKVAFSLFDICKQEKHSILIMRLVVLWPNFQSKGVYKFLLNKRLSLHQPSLLIGRFHNPRIYETLLNLNSPIYPNICNREQHERTESVLEVQKKYADTEEFDAIYSVAKNIYKNKRKEFLTAKEEQINQYYHEHVGKHDSLIVAVVLKPN